jgi:hypothetical protein
MRFAGGVGYVDMELDFDAVVSDSVNVRGAGITWQFDFGGALSDGVVLGAGYHGTVASDTTVDGDPAGNGTASFLMFGGFLSVFPDPRGGLELGGMLALALAEQSGADPFGNAGTLETEVLSGPGGALWVGYAGWVSANWALGGLVRVSAGWMSGSSQAIDSNAVLDTETTASARSVALCFNAVYQ